MPGRRNNKIHKKKNSPRRLWQGSIHPSIHSVLPKKKSEAPGSIILMMSTATVPFYIKRLDKRSVGSPGSRVKQTSPRIHVQESKSKTYHVCLCLCVGAVCQNGRASFQAGSKEWKKKKILDPQLQWRGKKVEKVHFFFRQLPPSVMIQNIKEKQKGNKRKGEGRYKE